MGFHKVKTGECVDVFMFNFVNLCITACPAAFYSDKIAAMYWLISESSG
jgi:hypothetical protein